VTGPATQGARREEEVGKRKPHGGIVTRGKWNPFRWRFGRTISRSLKNGTSGV